AEVVPGGTGDTWVQWRTKWNAQVGKHRIVVRVTDANGVVQDPEIRPVAPSGITGYHIINVSVV
ncbi:MAG: molybdopterin-binding oxidoreductase, partial [Actinomycetes bacterium]